MRTRIPRTEISFFATRLTNPGSNTVLHVVVTAFLAKMQKRTAANRVYVFAEKKNGVVVLAMNDYDRVNRAFLDDINGDGQPEVAVEWLEDMGKIGGVDIWTVSSADQLSSLTIPEPPAKYVEEFSTDLTRFVGEYTGPGDRTIVQSVYIAASGAPFTRRIYYRWDKSSRRYQIKEVQEVRETIKRLSADPGEIDSQEIGGDLSSLQCSQKLN